MKKDKQELETKSLIIDYDKKNELFRKDQFYKDNDKECYLILVGFHKLLLLDIYFIYF